MANAELANEVDAFLERYVAPESYVTVALSGGIDSVVLLHLLHSALGRHSFNLVAHHINHQISSNANSWEAFCYKLCSDLQIPLTVTRVQVDRSSGKGLEAAARSSRYRVFNKLATDYILLAHHQDDQAETLLLRLFRGTGVKGMAGMAEYVSLPEGSAKVLRPLLHISRSAIYQYARDEALEWVNDESNQNAYYTRNFFRNNVFPLIETHFPAYKKVLERAARHFAESSQLLDELGEHDGKDAIEKNKLSIASLRQLNSARAKNLLRFFLSQNDLKMPDHRRLDEFIRQLQYADSESRICLLHDSMELRVFKKYLYIVKPFTFSDDLSIQWNKKDYQWHIPELGGTLIFKETVGKGIALTVIENEPVSTRTRKGGERICLAKDRPPQRLKNMLQQIAMPPWERERLPLIYVNERLAYVPNIGCDIQFVCAQNDKGLVPEWIPENTI